MRPLSKIYEMARTRGEAMWAVLDWAAQQTGDFTMKDLYKVFQQAGGESTIQQFHSMVKVAKPWKDDQGKYGVSAQRPFVFSKRGSRGKGGAALLQWGLDGPLRAPQQRQPSLAGDDSPIGDIYDKLEDKLGRDALKAALQRWRRMTSVNQIATDIRSTVPARYQMDAIQIGTEHLVSSGKADEEDVEDAEAQLSPAAKAQAEPGMPATPFSPPKPRAQQPAAKKAAPTPAPPDDDDDEAELAAMGFRKVDGPANEPDREEPGDEGPGEDDATDAAFSGDDIPADFFDDDDGGGEARGTEDYPAYLPDPDPDGDKFEYAMSRLVDEGNLDADDPLWEKLKTAKNDVDAQQIIRKSNLPTGLQRSALIVAKAIFDNTGRDWETGKKMGESRLMRVYGEGPLTDPVDFDQTSGLKRVIRLKK